MDDIHNSVVTDILMTMNLMQLTTNMIKPNQFLLSMIKPHWSNLQHLNRDNQFQAKLLLKFPNQNNSKNNNKNRNRNKLKAVELKPSTPQVLAPWAAAKADSKKPALTLKEIQRLEAEN